jgi:hypothetical protein
LYQLAWVIITVFFVSLLSNVSPFVGASYTLFATLNLRIVGFSPFNFVLIVAISALGATLAKIVIYYGAFGLRKYLVRNKNVQLIGKNSTSGRFYVALFVTALLPVLPLDDFIYIGAGATSASIVAMASVTYFAKVIKSGFEIAIEYTLLTDISSAFGLQTIDVTILFIVVFLALGILIYKLDWEKLANRFRQRKGASNGDGARLADKRL